MIFALGVIGMLMVLGIIAGKEEIPKECKTSAVTKPFYRMAVWLDRFFYDNTKTRELLYEKNIERMRFLHSSKDPVREARLYVIEKLRLSLLLVAVGMVFTLLLGQAEQNERKLKENNLLLRNDFGEGKYSVHLAAVVGEEEYENIELAVSERKYSVSECRAMMPEFREKLEEVCLGENESLDHVEYDLNAVNEISGYPFYVEWRSENRELLKNDGRIGEDIPEEGVIVMMTAEISYEDFSELYSIPLMLYPQQLGDREALYQRLMQEMESADKISGTEKEFLLPQEIGGIRIIWDERKTGNLLVLVLAVAALGVAVFFMKDCDLDKKLNEKDQQMLKDYPEIVSKLTLYVGAGMTVRYAWKKIAEEGKASERFVYREMLLTVHEMETGNGELTAYQHFAKRCRVQRYIKLISLIEQSVKMGAKGFTENLRREAADALADRKSMAKRAGEEAGTKLLLPMVLMLAIVMAVIIVPAFMGI